MNNRHQKYTFQTSKRLPRIPKPGDIIYVALVFYMIISTSNLKNNTYFLLEVYQLCPGSQPSLNLRYDRPILLPEHASEVLRICPDWCLGSYNPRNSQFKCYSSEKLNILNKQLYTVPFPKKARRHRCRRNRWASNNQYLI